MPISSILDHIADATRADLAGRKPAVPLDALRERIAIAPTPRSFRDAVTPAPGGSARLIAELKRASPSKGLLTVEFDPAARARAYECGGAAAISVLTEPHFFQGSLDHLAAVRATVDLPILRKDFILDPYQVYEARAYGADAVLLICALLDDPTLADLLGLTRELGMEALVEAHDAAEVRRALAAGATVIGVNSRDLRTFEVLETVVRDLRPLVPSDCTFVAESGISSTVDAARARAFGADAILVGEALMRAADSEALARALTTAPGGTTQGFFLGTAQPFVKLCGLTTSEQVVLAGELGADAFGMVFHPPSHRNLAVPQARALADAAKNTSADLDHVLWPVAVVVNEPLDGFVRVVQSAGLRAIQLSGDESPAYVRELTSRTRQPVIKALRLRSEADLARLDAYALAGATLLIDTPAPDGIFGGTGRTSDWALAREAARRWPIILSGGLTPENVGEALSRVRPRGVDVSSGIETARVKDPAKMRAFVQAARVTGSALLI